MKTNNNLNELHHILQCSAEGFWDAILLIVELPPELHEQGLASCERWLSMLESDFNQFKKEVIGVKHHGEK